MAQGGPKIMYTIVRHHILNRQLERSEVYWAWTLKSFGLSFVSIFLPIYLYQLGYTVPTIFAYYLMMHIMRFCIEPTNGWLVARYGAKHVLAASFYLLLVQLGLFLTLPSMHWPLWLLSAISAMGLSAHFLALHVEFSSVKTGRNIGHEVSLLNELGSLGSALGPLLGGFIATWFGIQFSFVAALVVLSFAALPLFRTGEIHGPKAYNLRQLRLKPIWRDLVSEMGAGVDSNLVNFLWPFAIFLVVGSYATVGAITTLALLLTLVVSVGVGRLLDRGGHWRQLLNFGSTTTAFMHGIRIIAQTPFTVLLASIFGDMTHWFNNVPYIAAYYKHADRPDRIEYIVAMEMATQVGRIFFWLALWIVSMQSTVYALRVGYVLGAVGALLIMAIRTPRFRGALQ
jgi:MFS family permease